MKVVSYCKCLTEVKVFGNDQMNAWLMRLVRQISMEVVLQSWFGEGSPDAIILILLSSRAVSQKSVTEIRFLLHMTAHQDVEMFQQDNAHPHTA